MDIELRDLTRIQKDSLKIQKPFKATNKKYKMPRGSIMRMIINMSFTIINENKCKYK